VRFLVRTCVAVTAVTLLAAGCSRAASTGAGQPSASASGASATSTATGTASGGFGTLAGVCHPGSASGAPAQGVTASGIRVGVFTDASFTKDDTFPVTAKVFTSWCNAHGGIDGRKITYDTLDTALFNVQPKMVQACGEDFALVGGGAALDAAAINTRLECLLPAFPGEVVAAQNVGSSIQVYPGYNAGPNFSYAGYYSWLMKQAYPDSEQHVGIISGDVSTTQQIAVEDSQGIDGLGGKVTYNDLYPPLGPSDWTPYAEAIKSKGVKGLIFNGQWQLLAKLELALTNIGYKLDWIDANSDAYTPQFIQLAGSSLTSQNNYADLAGYYPVEDAASNPAMQQLVSLFKQYAPASAVTLPAIQSFAEWLLFAESAESCGSSLTRKCIYDAATGQTSWTAGGLVAASSLAPAAAPTNCFNAEKATTQGWQPAAFDPTNGAYRCGAPFFTLTGSAYIPPTTLASVGKTLADLK
jgi:Periplasmic binding protein